jgi:hypothetical protein
MRFLKRRFGKYRENIGVVSRVIVSCHASFGSQGASLSFISKRKRLDGNSILGNRDLCIGQGATHGPAAAFAGERKLHCCPPHAPLLLFFLFWTLNDPPFATLGPHLHSNFRPSAVKKVPGQPQLDSAIVLSNFNAAERLRR